MIIPGSFRMTARAATPNANGTFSTLLCQQLLNHAFVPTMSYVPAPIVYVALYTAPPTPAGGGAEVTGDTAYSRKAVTFGAAAGTPASLQNNAEVDWPVATVDWGLIFAAGLHDMAAGGNLLAYGLLLTPDGTASTPKLVQAGDAFLIGVGALGVGLA